MSWHPNTYTDFNNSLQDQSFFLDNEIYQEPTFHETAAPYGQYTPLSQPIVDEPQIHELITPLESLSAHEFGHHQHFELPPYSDSYWVSQQQHPIIKSEYGTGMDAMFPPSFQVPTWHWNNISFSQDLPTAPSSPNFLPIQGTIEASPLDLNTKPAVPPPAAKSDGEELVAMGLYDSPADVQSSSLLFGGGGLSGGPPRKRSLKLEEAFEPPPEPEKSAEEEDEGDNDAGSDEDADEEAISEPDDGTVAFPVFDNLGQPQMIFGRDSNMGGQSFYFDRKEPHIVATAQEQELAYQPYVMAAGLPTGGAGYGWF